FLAKKYLAFSNLYNFCLHISGIFLQRYETNCFTFTPGEKVHFYNIGYRPCLAPGDLPWLPGTMAWRSAFRALGARTPS
ncbi:MAG: hypothetical protein ACRCVK_09260, partial [Aeromonas veronii]